MSENRIALVTGASRGIGRAIARRLAADGCRVVGTATGEAGLELIKDQLGDVGTGVKALRLDVTSDESLTQFTETLAKEGLQPLILVNNAGISRDNLLLRMKDSEWDEVISANLRAVYKLSKHFIRPMIKARYGRIINITSVVGVAGNAGQTNYAAAKAGIIGFTKSLAQEVASRGITVNAVAPGFIDTDMTSALSEEQRRLMLSNVPAGRLGTPDDIAHAVAYLASDGGAYVTGETMHVNGGMVMV